MTQTYFKFLAGNLASGHDSEFYYAAPTLKKKTWKPGSWVTCPNPDRISKKACGVGLHLMKMPIPRYTRWSGNAYVAEGRELLGEDEEKARFKSIRLIRPVAFKEIFHPKAYLSGADLSEANLSGALNGSFSDEQLKVCYRKPNGDLPEMSRCPNCGTRSPNRPDEPCPNCQERDEKENE